MRISRPARLLVVTLSVGGLTACAEDLAAPANRSPLADLGIPDAGPPAGPDAGEPDATGLDAGHLDAGPADAGPSALDEQLAAVLAMQPIPPAPLEPIETAPSDVIALGEALFFDPVLSGNKDVACASCHQAEQGTADGLPLALGTGASGRGPARAEGGRPDWFPRHTQDLWNRGRLSLLFWDGRVSETSTAGRPVPEGIRDPLGIQAVHPIVEPREMLGRPGDVAVDGTPNELAGLPPASIYAAVEARLRAIDEYVRLFEAAFPGEGVSFAGVLTAIAAFQRERYDAPDTAWDRYLRGELTALNDAAKLGAQIFFGALGCGGCHSGPLLSDGRLHNVGVPLLSPVDRGGRDIDPGAAPFSFRTPPLRNVATSPPYMHNGVFATLQDVLRHYAFVRTSAASYDGATLPDDLRARVVTDPATIEELTSTLSPQLVISEDGQTSIGLSNVRQFLLHLVDEGAVARAARVPDRVPSGLLVGGR